MTRSNPSTDLGSQLQAGNQEVLERILRVHGPPILALLKQRFSGLLTPHDFEDVLGAALFRVWQHRLRFDPSLASLRVWLFRIAENIARDVLKHGWHKARQLELSLEPSHLAMTVDRRAIDHNAPVEADRNAPELRISPALLRELLALLPENQRRIVLADADSPDGQVASQQLATELGIPPSTVRVYRRRALERLRREIEQREQMSGRTEAEVTS